MASPLAAKRSDVQTYFRSRFLFCTQDMYPQAFSKIEPICEMVAHLRPTNDWEAAIWVALEVRTTPLQFLKNRPHWMVQFGASEEFFAALRSKLLEWYDMCGLDANAPEWACQAVGWRVEPPVPHLSTFDPPPLPSHFPRWSPVYETKAAWLKRATLALRSYANSVADSYNEANFVQVPDWPSLDKHMTWLAYRLVGSLSPEAIAIHENVAKQSVDEALKSMCSLLDLKPRPLRAGRKKK